MSHLSTSPLPAWTPGNPSGSGSAADHGGRVFNFNNLSQVQTAALVKRHNLGRALKRSARGASMS
ncbi:hypothetical protein [Nocardia sp. NPDC005825]|uniref:hypothetical protein n=1 Tax=unclassified Nocardia TaxID=2637762 RepID=UPI00341055AB